MPVGGGGAWPDNEPTRRASHQRPGAAGVEGAGGPGGRKRAWPQCPWAAAGPGRTTSRRAEPRISDQAPPVWRAPEGPEDARGHGCGARGRWQGLARLRADAPSLASATRHRRCGGRRRVRRARAGFEIDHSEPLGSRVAISRAAGPDGARNTIGAASTAADQAAPQAPPEIRRRCKHRPNQSELLVVLRVLVGLAAAWTPERADRRHLFRRKREGEDVEVLALTLRVTRLGQGQGAELVVPAQNEA